MIAEDFSKLAEDTEHELLCGARAVAILGLTDVTLRLLTRLGGAGLLGEIEGIYCADAKGRSEPVLGVAIRPVEELSRAAHDVVVVASDEDKQDLLLAALPYIAGVPKVIVAGYGHLAFRDPMFRAELGQLLVPSLANGYPHSLVHLYQCLVNAARLGLRGVVAEFGMFKGGTTVFLARVVELLGMDWPVIGFDSFSGFPARRSPLDMYDHPDCVFTDLDAVRRVVAGHRIEIVTGDIVDSASRLLREDVVLTFVDTDNYSSACAALDVCQQRTVVGGAIVFDHFTGVDRFRYTIGERIAGLRLLDDHRFFHLHGTGVFYRQR